MRRTIEIPLFDTQICVVVSEDTPNKAARKHGLSAPFPHGQDGATEALTYEPTAGTLAPIAVFMHPKATVNACAHEAFHVATLLAERAGFDFQVEHDNETLAYITGFVAQTLHTLSRSPA